MSDRNQIIKLAVDSYKGKVQGNFSKEDNTKVLREALIELNGGSTKLNYKTMRNNAKAIEMFEIIEEILNITVMGGLEDNPFFKRFVDSRNLALGDENSFYTPDKSIFVVSELSEGIANIRRQRLTGGTSVSVATKLYGIAIVEELNRILAGRVDFNDMMAKVALSFDRDFATKTYNALYNNFASLDSAFTVAGAYSETSFQNIVDSVEAATGKSAIIMGTKAALKNVSTAVVTENMKEAYSTLGYYGSFYSTPMMEIKNNFTPNTYTFQLSNKDIYIVSADNQMIKAVFEGDNVVAQNNPTEDDALQSEYKYFMRYGLAIMLNEEYGHYRLP